MKEVITIAISANLSLHLSNAKVTKAILRKLRAQRRGKNTEAMIVVMFMFF